MKNKEIIKRRLNDIGYGLGAYNDYIDKLSKAELKMVIINLDKDSSKSAVEVGVMIGNTKHVVTINERGDDKIIDILSKEEYLMSYSNSFKR